MSKIEDGEYHGGRPTSHGTGFMLLSFEKWLGEGESPLSAALRWKGKTAGPIHDALIEKHFPGAQTTPGEFNVGTQS